ncbi:MAG: metal-dependent hydrolase [Alphaproteobacteria bacterium]|nr:metal-dependent hydrolase [Alphaproteobacteria bacterium]
MDPLTQGVLGAALPQASRTNRAHVAIAGLFGLIAGMAPDLDVLIRSETDTLLYLEYHRQFSHSLIFIPIGGLLCAALIHLVLGRRWQLNVWQTFAYCSLGYATHGLLDAATSYGTQLFWPFSDRRVAWDIISIIDPLFTLPLVIGVVASMIKRNAVPARVALCWCALYLSFAIYQNAATREIARELANERGHRPERLTVKPSFANLVVWKSIYLADGRFYVDAIRPTFGTRVYQGESVALLNVPRDLPWLDDTSQQAEDIRRFSHFSDDYLSIHPQDGERVIDVRYSMLPNAIDPLWSIRLDPSAGAEARVVFRHHRDESEPRIDDLWSMIIGSYGAD